MADTKISALTDGTALAPTDRLPVARSPFATGDNRYITGSELADYVAGTLPSARTVLAADTTFYVRSDGSDSNDGSANDAAHAFLTIQGCYDYLCDSVDFAGYSVAMQVGPGTYRATHDHTGANGVYDGGYAVLMFDRAWTGGGTLTLRGDTTTPANCYLAAYQGAVGGGPAGGIVNLTVLPGTFFVEGFKIDAGEEGINNQGSGQIVISGNMTFAACTNGQLCTFTPSALITVARDADYTIDGADGHTSSKHMYAANGSIVIGLATIAMINNPILGDFARAEGTGGVVNNGGSFSGSFTGNSWTARLGGLIQGYFPAGTSPPGMYWDGRAFTDEDPYNYLRYQPKFSDHARKNTTTLAICDYGLKVYLEATSIVTFKIVVFYDTPTASDFKFDLNGTQSATSMMYRVSYIGPDDTSLQTTGIKTAYNQVTTITATTATKGYVEIGGWVHQGATAGELQFRWAPNASVNSDTTVYGTSYLEVIGFG